MKKIITALIAGGALALAGCGSTVDGFPDEATKERVWHFYSCDAFGRLDAPAKATSLNMEILSGDVPPSDRAEARHWADRLSGADTVGDVISRESGKDFDDMCSGWLWEQEMTKSGYWDGYDEFTYEKAEAAGVVK